MRGKVMVVEEVFMCIDNNCNDMINNTYKGSLIIQPKGEYLLVDGSKLDSGFWTSKSILPLIGTYC